MIIIDKEDLIDAMMDIDYPTKVIFTMNGEEYNGDVQVYGGDLEPKVIEICLTPKMKA